MHFRRSHALLALCFITLCGCVSSSPRLQTERDASEAAGVHDAIEFRISKDPVDVGETHRTMLTLPAAVRMALMTHPDIQAALGRVRLAQAEAEQARLLPNPVVAVDLRFPENGGRAIIEAGLTHQFVALLRRPGLARAADDRLRAASAQAVQTVLDVLAEVAERYVAAQTADVLLDVLRERREIVSKLSALARSRLDQGEGTRLDVLTFEAQQVELDTEIAERELERREQRLALARLIGRPLSESTWELERWRASPIAAAPEKAWVQVALSKRPEVQVRQLELSSLGAELDATRLAPFAEAEVGVAAERDEDWSVGPAVSSPIPIFDTGQAQRDRARAAIIEARHRLTQTERQIIEETRRAYAAFSASHENLNRVRSELVPLQQRRRDQAEAQFRGGEADVTALLLAEQELRAARTRLVELERRAATALIRLERAVGGPGAVSATTQPSGAVSVVRPDTAQRD